MQSLPAGCALLDLVLAPDRLERERRQWHPHRLRCDNHAGEIIAKARHFERRHLECRV